MIERLDYVALNGPAIGAMVRAKQKMGSIDPKLRAIVEIRISQINGCAYCVDTHLGEARGLGETQQRLDCLATWRECAFFSDAERAALDWAEAITHLPQGGAPQALYDVLRSHFEDQQVVDLTLIISQMNAWNRLAVSFGHQPDPRA